MRRTFTVQPKPGGVTAYHRILGKRGTLSYPDEKVIIAYFMPDRPETLVSGQFFILQNASHLL
jgi:hypothetical protein